MRNTPDIFAKLARICPGLTDDPVHRCKLHRVGIRAYLIADEDAVNVGADDQNFAEAMLEEKYVYCHVVLPQIIRTAHRILEDILMISLKAGVHDDILTNVNQGITMANHRDYGIHSDADRYAIGANLLTHLLDSDEKTIDVLELSEIVRLADFACPIEKCTAVLGRLERVKKHLEVVHKMKNQLEVIDLLEKVPKLKCSFVGCELEFGAPGLLRQHEQRCQHNPKRLEGNTIECENTDVGCDRKFSDIDAMKKHAVDCKYHVKNRPGMFECPNEGCKRLFTHKASVNPHVNHHCEFTAKKIRTLKCQFCDQTFSRFSKKEKHERDQCKENPNYVKTKNIKCDVAGCKWKFRTSDDLKRHKYRHHKQLIGRKKKNGRK